jgi:hypothetical protein
MPGLPREKKSALLGATSVPRKRAKNTTLFLASMSVEGMGPCLAVVGSSTKVVFEAYVERVLCPTDPEQGTGSSYGQSLRAHKGERVKELIEQRGCELSSTCCPTHQISILSRKPSPRSRACLLRKAEARSTEKLVEAMGVGQSRRLERKTPAVSSSIAGTACRFNRYDER